MKMEVSMRFLSPLVCPLPFEIYIYRKVLQSAPVLCTEFCYCTTLIAPPKID